MTFPWEPSSKELNELNQLRTTVGLTKIPAGTIKTSGQWQQACTEIDELEYRPTTTARRIPRPTKRFNHAFTIAFSLETDHKADDVTEEELLDALSKRLDDITKTGEIIEAAGTPYDTYENDLPDHPFKILNGNPACSYCDSQDIKYIYTEETCCNVVALNSDIVAKDSDDAPKLIGGRTVCNSCEHTQPCFFLSIV